MKVREKYKLPSTSRDLEMRMRFLVELEKLKTVYRQNSVIDGSRQENSAEHSWHVTMMALLLHEYSDKKKTDLLKVLKMLLIHDIVEIDAGDTFLYDEKGNAAKARKETASAKRIFGLLPPMQKKEFLGLWKEFEKRESPEALFAASMDGLQPLLNRYVAGGRWDQRPGLEKSKVIENKKFIEGASKKLWKYTQDLIDRIEKEGLFSKAKSRHS